MSHPLEARIAAAGRQVRRLVLAHGASRVLATVVGAALVLGLLDYGLRFRDPGLRVIATLAVLAVFVWSVRRYLLRAWRYRPTRVELARRVERRFPSLGDRLSTSIDFVSQPESDAQAGSAALRRAVVAATTAEAEPLDFSAAIDRRPSLRAMLAAGGVCLLVAIVVVADPAGSHLALARLANPFASHEWPRRNNLQFHNPPQRIASGQTFEARLVDRFDRPLPDTVRIVYRYEGTEDSAVDTDTMRPVAGAIVARRDNVTRPFSYRAEGGDDRSMAWIPLEVVEAPRVESMQVRLHPPAYTTWPVQLSDRNIRALRGTRVEIAGTATKRIAAVTVELENGPSLPAKITQDGFGFELSADGPNPLVVDKSGAYALRFKDFEQFDGGALDRWEIRALADEPPSVVLDRPAADVMVTPEAELPLKIVVKDDLSIKDVVLHFARSDRSDVGDFTQVLFAVDRPAAVEPTVAVSEPRGDSRVVEHVWSLAELGLKPGVQITFHATASDFLPQEGRSAPRRLSIVTPRELEDRVAQRQALVLAELARVLKMQQEARGQVSALEIQLREVGRLAKQDIDHAQGAELGQRQVNRTLTSRSEGVPAQVVELLADLAGNKIDSPDVERRMNHLLAEIERLGRDHLPATESGLTAAIKGAQAQSAADEPAVPEKKPDAAVASALESVGQHQDEVVRTLEAILGDLAEWDSFRRFARDVDQLRRDQEETARLTRQAGLQTLGKDLRDLDPQQQADLKKLSARQLDLARRLDKSLQQMGDSRDRIAQTDPLASASLGDALELARKQGLSSAMRDAGGQVERNQVGQAARAQEQSAKNLADIVDVLANRREHELSRLVKKLREAEAQLAELAKRQGGLRKKSSDLAGQADNDKRKQELQRLGQEQREMEQEARRLARQLERLQAERPSRSLSQAGGKMARAGESGEAGDAAAADEQAAAAEKDLDEAQAQLAERRRQAEADLAREQIARLQDAIRALRERQIAVVAEIDRLEGLRKNQERLDRAQSQSLLSLAREQVSLEAETRAQSEKLEGTTVFRLALDSAADDMRSAGALLEQRETGAVTRRHATSAIARLDQVLEAIKAGKDAAKQAGESQQGGEGGSQQSNADAVRALSEIKLLKLMQESLNRRFAALVDPSNTNEPADRETQLEELGREQGRLAETALGLVQPEPEEEPGSLPDLKPDNSEPQEQPAEPQEGTP